MLLTCYITCIIITQGYYGTFRGDSSIFKILVSRKNWRIRPLWWIKMYLFVAILDNGRHLGFSIDQSDGMDLISIAMSHANFGACIIICTIHPKNANYLLHSMSVTTCPKATVTTCPNVISLTKFQITPFFFHMAYFCRARDDSHEITRGMLTCNTKHTTIV